METFKIKLLMILLGMSMLFASCEEDPSDKEVEIGKPASQARKNDPVLKTLVITGVRTPWYALRSMVLGRMRKSIPEYQAIKGLKEKFYAFTDHNRYFGGIYFWDKEENARNWFNDAWFERTEEKYGERGTAVFYKILNLENVAEILQPEGKYYAVLSKGLNESGFKEDVSGLIRIVYLENEKGDKEILTLWQSKKAAESYFENSGGENIFYDTPILLDNKTANVH